MIPIALLSMIGPSGTNIAGGSETSQGVGLKTAIQEVLAVD